MAGLAGRIPNFDGLLDGDQPKDTEVTIVEEAVEEDRPAAEGSKKRSRQATSGNHITMQAHWVVLRSLSSYFQTKLERWSPNGHTSKKSRNQQEPEKQQQQQQQDHQQPPYQYSLQLLVPPGQLELGRRLITSMYSSSPDMSDLEAPQLLQLVTLAECYGVGKVVADAAAQLHTMSVESMPLDTAAAVFELPEACLELEAVQQVRQAAADRLQQQLGDLEVTWGNEDKQQQLLGLPFGALLQLLRDERTRVASEDTAVITAQNWMDIDDRYTDHGYQQQLVRVLRLPHCSSTCLARLAVDKSMEWVYDNDTELLEGLLAVAGRSSSKRQQWARDEAPDDKAAWRLPPRPASAVAQLQLSWDLPLSDIEKALAADPGEMVGLDSSAVVMWHGRHWRLSLEYTPHKQELEAYLSIQGAPAFVDATIRLESTPNRRTSCIVILDEMYMQSNWGGVVAKWGADRMEWPQVAAWLQEKGLVHPDGCLHLRATVTRVT